MGRIIDMKIPVEYFVKDRENRLEARLAKFSLHHGDIIRFHEWDMKGKRYTGRYFDREVKDLHKIRRATRFWRKSDLLRFGLYVMELGRPRHTHAKKKFIRPVNTL